MSNRFKFYETKPQPTPEKWTIRAGIIWHPVSKGLPDSDTSVLIACSHGSEPVWIGYHDGEDWHAYLEGNPGTVTHWADLPEAPKL